MSLSATDTRAAILRNARAAQWEGYLNRVDPGRQLPEDERVRRAQELRRQELGQRGALGGAVSRRRAGLELRVEQAAAVIRARMAEVEDCLAELVGSATCGHVWPAELVPDAVCVQGCGTTYGEWSE